LAQGLRCRFAAIRRGPWQISNHLLRLSFRTRRFVQCVVLTRSSLKDAIRAAENIERTREIASRWRANLGASGVEEREIKVDPLTMQLAPGFHRDFDVVIIGAGAAGLAAAQELRDGTLRFWC
jgi:hypothetical protein